MIQGSPMAFYTERIEWLTKEISKAWKRFNTLGAMRLLTFIVAATAAYFLWENVTYVALVLAAGLAIFLALVSMAQKVKQHRQNLETLLAINKEELAIQNGQYTTRPDGLDLQPPHHPYAHDLDIMGKASLFQYIHRTTSEQGHQLLANWLLQPGDETSIQQRQEAAKELRPQQEWLQQLRAYGSTNALNTSIQQSLAYWLQQPHHFRGRKVWQLARYLLPAISIGLLLLYITDIARPALFYSMLLVFFAVSGYISKLVTPQYLQLSKHITQFETLSQSLQWIESATFKCELLAQLQKQLESPHSDSTLAKPASKQVQALKQILDRMDYRLNPLVFIPLNIFLSWDLQQVIQLEQWKAQHKKRINNWFDVIAHAEAISSLATLSFNHPAWVFPVITPHWFSLTCQQAGHPLIPPQKSVVNDLHVQGYPQLAFVTGSNMAGKSTFLRTIGTNLVLAMAGAPTCAAQFETPVLSVMTSMRIADNLEESASTFYAELQKLKNILDAVKHNNGKQPPIRVFLLLDEILRGTNSLDRHTGSEALIKQLVKEEAVGIIASHDLGLADLQSQFPGIIHNYHFDVTINGNELSFDYKLKQGVCQTLNATLLMRKIGIEI
jgi:hypothetical protein